MKIGVDGRDLKTGRAIFRYTRSLLNALAQIDSENEYFLFLEGEELLGGLDFLKLDKNWRLVKAQPKIVLRDHFFFARFLKRFELDVFFHPDNTEFLFCHPKSIVTVHDVIPFLLPKLSLSGDPLTALRQKIYLFLQARSLRWAARRLITVSENSKRDLVRLFNLNESKVSVIYEAVDESFRPASPARVFEIRQKFGLNENYLFCHGGYSPYKNLERLLAAFAHLAAKRADLQLVLGGAKKDHDHFRQVLRQIKLLGLDSRVVLTDYVAEEDLGPLYTGARLLVYPSLYEGFGLPILEAQACGTPVVCSNRASLPEVAGLGADYFNPEDVGDMNQKMESLLRSVDRPRELREEGFRNVARFSWEKCARQTLEVFEKVHFNF